MNDTLQKVFDNIIEEIIENFDKILEFMREAFKAVVKFFLQNNKPRWRRINTPMPRPLLLDKRERIHRCRNAI